MTERYLIRYFLAVVDAGSFSQAATSVNVTQPTLSAGISKLEDQLGLPLFRRTNRRVHLTEAGNRLLPHARRIESEFNQSIAAVRETEPVRLLRIGILNTISMRLVSPAIQAMLEADPNLNIEVLDGTERELSAKLLQERIDFALMLVGRGSDRFEERKLFEEGYVVALPSAHPLADSAAVNAEQLANSVMIVRRQCEVLSETSRFFTERGVRPFFAYRSSRDERVMSMISAGLGLTIAPSSHTAEGVAKTKLNGFNLTRKVGLAFSAHVSFQELSDIVGFRAFENEIKSNAVLELN